jgi:hypothetical protein
MPPFVHLERTEPGYVLVCAGCGHRERVVAELAYQPQVMLMHREHRECCGDHESTGIAYRRTG